jgi:hypothetical protein
MLKKFISLLVVSAVVLTVVATACGKEASVKAIDLVPTFR